MSDQLPADIAEAIEALECAIIDGAYYQTSGIDDVRAALDAVILKHLRGDRTPLMREAPAMLGALQCVVAAMEDMGFRQLTRSDSCPVLREALLDLIATAEGRDNLRAVQ